MFFFLSEKRTLSLSGGYFIVISNFLPNPVSTILESRNYMPQPVRFLVADVSLRVPLTDHTANENRIMRSQLIYTIVRPGSLTYGGMIGQLKHGFEAMKMKGNPSISRSNVAAFMLAQLSENTYLKKCVWLFE